MICEIVLLTQKRVKRHFQTFPYISAEITFIIGLEKLVYFVSLHLWTGMFGPIVQGKWPKENSLSGKTEEKVLLRYREYFMLKL